MKRLTGESKQFKAKKDKSDKSKNELKKDLDADLILALEDADSHESRVELLLTQIIRELKKVK